MPVADSGALGRPHRPVLSFASSMRYEMNIDKPAWLVLAVARLMKPLCRFSVLVPLAALGLVGTLLLIIGQRHDSKTMLVIGLFLSLPFLLWAAMFLCFLFGVLALASAKILSGGATLREP